ncbi:homoserine O-acetyltransferase [Prosthecobacter sp.]|uniref:homoserine O-acetyltransferase MetX n=1 Tax=Prosthecobacter sp. TaxID=1965333 RepID=UPI002AB94D94|nr:homoserine O-acetyltransferase [Prosthecobacter sp.]MDZ4405115.1 homoserine O-acetyltransferase [Prosthecobacter sp.]
MSKAAKSEETKFFHTGSAKEPFVFASGDQLPGITVAYETYGKLNAAKSNAILLFHALSGSQHAAGITKEVAGTDERWTEDCHTGWWDLFIGPDKALDTNRYFIICANYLGGCYGTSGPASLNPATGKPYGSSFPAVRTSDVVNSHLALLDHLGIQTLHAVMGSSVGGLLAINLATLYPERVKLVVPIASGCRTTVLTRLTLFEQVLAIENDPHFKGGDYYQGEAPEYGLALARMISHKTFVHLDTIERRARQDLKHGGDTLSWYRVQHNVESYMLHQGKKFVKRFDANTYLRIADMWLRFDPLRDAGVSSYAALFERSAAAGQHYLVFSIDSDFCFYPEEQAELVSHLEKAEVSNMHITVHSDKGHDSFLLEPQLYTPHLSFTLDGRWNKSSVDRPVPEVE